MRKFVVFLFLVTLLAPACSIWYMGATGLSNKPYVIQPQKTVWWFNRFGHGDASDYAWTGWASMNEAKPYMSTGSNPRHLGAWTIGGSSVWVPVRASQVPFDIKCKVMLPHLIAWILLLGIFVGCPILAIIGKNEQRPTVRRRGGGGGGYVAMREIFWPIR